MLEKELNELSDETILVLYKSIVPSASIIESVNKKLERQSAEGTLRNKKDLSKMTKTKLVKKLDETRDSLVNLKFQKKLQQLENPNTISNTKKEIAQIKTVLREMELGIREEK